ncbi:phosphoribosyltransferase [Paenibacillus lautus]|uniref:phosphoribosyltransferase n=1 Tax=Paenibacillus lautus TaxID=1401 RepID=UPI003D276934
MDKSRKKTSILSAERLVQLSQLFSNKSWEIENDDPDLPSLFNRFCILLSELSEPQQLLVLELTERFTRITSDQYKVHIKKILDHLSNDPKLNLTQIKTIYIAPLIAPEDIGKSKSSTFVQYLFTEQFHYISHFADKNVRFVNGLEADSSEINNEQALLIVVDDFIGTGDTACSALNYLLETKKISTDKIIVASIVALSQGIQKIIESGVHVIVSLTLNKGISEHYPITDISSKIEIMETIESQIKVHRNEKLGYGKSEALVSMIRTPNNTFPVFWKEKKGRVAPFPRKNL